MAPAASAVFLQSPLPLHFSAKRRIPSESLKSINVSIIGSSLPTSYRRDSSILKASTIFPGLKMFCGSKAALILFKSVLFFSPIINGINSARTIPSPCSPLKEPLYFLQRSATSVVIFLKYSTPSFSFKFRMGRKCNSPAPAWA